MPLAPHLDPSPPNSVPTILPGPFWPEHEDDKYFHIGEDRLTGCIRDAVREAGKDRWIEIVRSGGPDQFLTKIRDDGLVGEDTNRDSNLVDGLVYWVHTVAEDDDPNLDTDTNDPEKCASLVKRFATPELVDELIVGWAEREGHIERLPPTKPEPEETHVRGNLTHHSPGAVIRHGPPEIYWPFPHLNLTIPGSPPTPLNQTTHGKLTLHPRHVSFKTGSYSNSSAPSHSSSPENSGETGDEKDFLLALKFVSQVEPEIFELFERNSTLVNNFFDQPEINELLFQAIEEQQAGDGDVMADPVSLLEFVKDFVQNATANSFTGP